MLTLLLAAALGGGPDSMPGRTTIVQTAILPGVGEVQIELERFEVLDHAFVMKSGDGTARGGAGAGTAGAGATPTVDSLESIARSVRAYSGVVVGFHGSHAYLAESPRGRVGMIEVAGRRFALAPVEGGWAGPVRGPERWVESPGAGAPLVEEACRLLPAPGDEAGGGGAAGHGDDGDRGDDGDHGNHGEGGIAGDGDPPGLLPIDAVRGARVRVAADCDFEFTSIFAGEEDCTAYVVSLYGAISSIYEREMGVRVQLSYLRLWLDANDPYQDPDPLYQFRDLWNATQQDVVRDVAQLLTGRRNLPYGGVAWLSSACGQNGYSVCGYLIGSFVDAGRPNPGNWDIIVTAHELGHNIGTLHTHSYGIDTCASGTVLRGGFMSYCHTVSGATANVDLSLHRILREVIAEFLVNAQCIGFDCDGDGVNDAEAIGANLVADLNGDGIPDSCQDCDDDGVLDPDEILQGAPDVDGNGIPDGCDPDCNGNGVVDLVDIWQQTSLDRWGNDVPDECETDCNGNGISDYTEITDDMSLDLDRNAQIDACQDCDGDGTLDTEVLGSSRHWWVATTANGSLGELHPRSGVRLRTSEAAPESVRDLALAADGTILGTFGDQVGRWDSVSGALIESFPAGGTGGASLSNAQGLLVMEDGSMLVASFGNASIRHYSASGAPLGVFAQLTATNRPMRLARRSDGAVAASATDGRVYGFAWPSGAALGVFADLNPIGASPDCTGVLYLPNGDLLVASRTFDAIHRFDGMTGLHKGRFDVGPNPTSSISLRDPMSMRLYADDTVVLVTATASGAPIVGLAVKNGYHLRTYRVYPIDAPSPTGLLVMPASPLDCNGNHVPDSCDLADGSSEDGNGDGTPDECQGGPWAPEDLDFDGDVDGSDLGALLGQWDACPGCPADFNGDGVVDGDDLGSLLGAWTG
ncbi:MAG: hypothetical protein FJ253_02045 [Phycisphaerae bacterium]|nr:hypothetical protein [Phycisphaerae bacterium]